MPPPRISAGSRGTVARSASPPTSPAPPPVFSPRDALSDRVSNAALRTPSVAATGAWGDPEAALSGWPRPVPLPAALAGNAALVEIPVAARPDRRPADDDRRRVITTDHAPWRWICALTAVMPSGDQFSGTGWLVGPRTVVTAGHNIHDLRTGGWARWVEVYVGRDGGSRQSTHVSDNLHSVRGWVERPGRSSVVASSDLSEDRYDYATVILPQPVRIAGAFEYALVSDEKLASLSYAHLAGYPADQDDGTLWGVTGLSGLQGAGDFLLYRLSTFHGQSGAPVYYTHQGLGRRVAVGIHTSGVRRGKQNLGGRAVRITPVVAANIAAWMEIADSTPVQL